MLFLFGVACVVFVSVFGKLHKNCTGTTHVFGVLLAGMRIDSSAGCFCFTKFKANKFPYQTMRKENTHVG